MIFIGILLVLYLVMSVLMCLQESDRRKISFPAAMIIVLLTSPLVGYFILSSLPLRHPRGCKWCGNTKNEAVYCGLCGRNEAGEWRTSHPS